MKKDKLLQAVLKKLADKYEYIKPIGQGAFSKVYLIRHKILRDNRALKIMAYKDDIGSEEFNEIKRRFINEARLIEKMNHPNIVRLHDIAFIKDEKKSGIDIPYTIMTVMQGTTLKDLLKKEVTLDRGKVKGICEDILGALTALHEQGIVHRDIKPDNIIIEQESGKAIMIDFGFAEKLPLEPGSKSPQSASGTPVYMAPERFQDAAQSSYEADIYSFGVLLYEMLAGEVPYKGSIEEIKNGHLTAPIPDVRDKNPLVPRGIQRIIEKAMAKEPAQRFRNAADLWHDLKDEIEKEDKRRRTDEAKAAKPERKSKQFYLIFLGIIIVAAIAIYLAFAPKFSDKVDISYKDAVILIKKNWKSGDLKKAKYYLDYAKEIKDTPELKKMSDQIEVANMKNDFQALKEFIKEKGVDAATKKEECVRFSEKYKDAPKSDETISINVRLNKMIKQLEKEIDEGEARRKRYISDSEKYIKNRYFDKAYESLESAKKIGENKETQRLEDRLFAAFIYEAEDSYKKTNYKEAKRCLSVAKKIKPDDDLQKLENRIDLLIEMPGYVKSVLIKSKTKEIRIEKTNGLWHAGFADGIVMVYIPGGTGYWMGKTEVTIKQYMRFANSNKENSHQPEWLEKEFHIDKEDSPYKGFVEDELQPVVGISWEDAKAYCLWLSAQTGLTFKLPSETQWEKAARGTDGRDYPWGNKFPDKELANYLRSGVGKTRKVGSYPRGASPYGLLEMAGNVEEFCEDRFGHMCIARGGSYRSAFVKIKSSDKGGKYMISQKTTSLGFRLCM